MLVVGPVLAALAAVVWYLVARFSPLSGSVPLLHAGIPWGFSEEAIPDLAGKVALVTGANVGLGRSIAQLLVNHGAHVHITCRSETKCRQATQGILLERPVGGAGSVTCSVLELSSLASVKGWLQDRAPPLQRLGGLDILILNAGVMGTPFKVTEDDIEWVFGVNHVAHFALGQGLMPLVELAAEKKGDARVVVVSSVVHWLPWFTSGLPLDLAVLNDPRLYGENTAYGRSKLANILYATELQKRLDTRGSKVFVNSVHPGGVQSDILRHFRERIAATIGDSLASAMKSLLEMLYWSERVAALTVLHPATSPEVTEKGIRGQYYVPVARLGWPSPPARSAALAEELWNFTEALLQERGWGSAGLPPQAG